MTFRNEAVAMIRSRVDELNNAVRTYINTPRVQNYLMERPIDWNRVCSSLDVIGDAQYGIDSYEEIKANGQGATYILIYGILQAFIVQQDAVRYLASSLNADVPRLTTLSEIRRIRIITAGHPTYVEKEKYSTFLVRMSLTMYGYTLLFTDKDGGEGGSVHVDLRKLIREQSEGICVQLNAILDEVKKQDVEHKRKFNSEKLRLLFPDTLDYQISKLTDDKNPSFAGTNAGHLLEKISKFRECLFARGILGKGDTSVIQWTLDDTEYSLEEILKFHRGSADNHLRERDLRIFAHYLSARVDDLRQIATEIDREYET